MVFFGMGQVVPQGIGVAGISDPMGWWREARFGLFIHWGLYAIPAGEWNGKTGYGEWIRHSARIPLPVYDTFREHFNPVGFDAEEWVRVARDAGMRYIVITSKHHDGFCMFNTARTDFSIMHTPYEQDVMDRLADACRKYGLKMCFYYSIMDWHHPDYLPRRDWETGRSAEGAVYDRYVSYMKDQLRELLTQYGDIGVLWFDGEWESTWNEKRGKDLYQYVKSLQPAILINNRVGAGRLDMEGLTKEGAFGGDFGTPEQQIPPTGLPGVDWETCMTMNDHWGYNRNDHNYKSAGELIRMLSDIASKGGNFLLNVGPTAEGTFPEKSISRLSAIGAWMKVNGEAIYGTTSSPFRDLTWGRCTRRDTIGGCRLYLHIFDWPENGKIKLSGVLNEPMGASLLAEKGRSVMTERSEDAIILSVGGGAPDTICSVIALDLKGKLDMTEPPEIICDYDIFTDTLEVLLRTSRENVDIFFTLNGDEPDTESSQYTRPLVIRGTCLLTARCFREGKPVSGTVKRIFQQVYPQAAKSVFDLKPGIQYKYYEGDWDSLPDFSMQKHRKFGIMTDFLFYPRFREERFAFQWAGYIRIPSTGPYMFSTGSDDGSRLYINDKLVVDNDGLHGYREKSGVIALREGYHKIRVEYFEKTGSDICTVFIASPGMKRQILPKTWLFHATAK